MKSTWMITLSLSPLGLLFSSLAQAQFCSVTNASLAGPYGYAASQGGAMATTTSGTGTTTTTGTTGAGSTSPNTYSGSNIGQLLGGIAAGNQFAFSGVWNFDGSGNITATSAPVGTTIQRIGTYNVNSDCSLTVSVTDVFGSNKSTTQLAGVVLGRGSEIDLTSIVNVQTQAASNGTSGTTAGTATTTGTTTGTGTTTTTTTTSSTQTASGLSIKLVRTLYQNGCSVSNLDGLYGFVLTPLSLQTQTGTTTGTGTTTTTTTGTTGTGTTTTTGSTTTSTATLSQPAEVIGYLDFNGAGQIVAQTSMSTTTGTAYSSLQFTGIYSVNADCSGSMTISNSSASAMTTTTGTSTGTTTTTVSTGTTSASTQGESITLNFVVTPPVTSSGPQAPELDLSFSTAEESGSGYAVSQ